MVGIRVEEDCGNAPKKAFVRDFLIAFVNNQTVDPYIVENLDWKHHGLKKLPVLSRLDIDSLLSHGNRVAASGSFIQKEKRIRFHDLYTFNGNGKNAKIASIESYWITE